jgi:Enoyl-CoA hydratase/carnithine racemase
MIDLEITDGVAFITLNAPATRNALNNELAGQFVAACDEADRDRRSAPPSSRAPAAPSAPGPSAATWTRSAATRRRRTGTPPSAASTAPSPGSASWRCRP